MTETFQYTIREFNKDTKVITVDFADGAWAEIQLAYPLPKNLEELETLIKQFTPSMEIMTARADTATDLSFIDANIGVEKECMRSFSTLEMPELQRGAANEVIL